VARRGIGRPLRHPLGAESSTAFDSREVLTQVQLRRVGSKAALSRGTSSSVELPAADAGSLKISFSVHLVWRVRPEGVKDFVEKFSTLYDDRNPDRIVQTAYANFLQEPLRTYARDEIQRLNGLEIKDRITPVGEAISKRVLELTRDTPFLDPRDGRAVNASMADYLVPVNLDIGELDAVFIEEDDL